MLTAQFKSLQVSIDVPDKKRFIKKVHLQLTRKIKCLITVGVIAIVVISCFAFLSLKNNQASIATTQPQSTSSPNPSPTPSPTSVLPSVPSISGILSGISHAIQSVTTQPKTPGVVESSPAMNDTVWTEVAANAWAFFQPGVGVDATTGLPYAGGTGFKAFTDWDLGAYVQAVIDAQEMGLIGASGKWGSYNRLSMVLTFLQTRPLNATTDWPFWFYDATNGQGYLENTTYASDTVNTVDEGKLLVALNNVIAFNASYKQTIDSIVFDGRSNYTSLLPSIESCENSNSMYAYYTACGFAGFWPKQLGNVPNQIMTNIENSPTITTYGVTLPDVELTCEPLLLSIFEVNTTDSRLTSLMSQVYQAQVAYYYANKDTYAAFSEGSSPYNGYVYEWIVAPNGSTWQITNATLYYFSGMNPVIFTKVAFGFLALYNSTFARNMVIYLEQTLPTPTNGYYGGVDTGGSLEDATPGSETNCLILDAALYYIQNNPNN